MAALLCAKDLCKTYVIDKRQNNVLKNVNLEVKEGEMVAIMENTCRSWGRPALENPRFCMPSRVWTGRRAVRCFLKGRI